MRETPRLRASAAWALLGGIVPACIGLAATFLIANFENADASLSIIIAWTVFGFLSLADFGLSRASARDASNGAMDVKSVVQGLWRTSVLIALFFTLVGAILAVAVPMDPNLMALLAAPLVVSLQFPLVGALEGCGRFELLAVFRVSQASVTFLFPAVACDFLGPAASVSVIVMGRILLLVWLTRTVARQAGRQTSSIANLATEVGTHRSLGSGLGWLALSSVLGPAFLYSDRLVLGLSEVNALLALHYVLISEVLLKAYVLPSAAVSVFFPHIVRSRHLVSLSLRRLILRTLPLVAWFMGALIASAILGGTLDFAFLQLLSFRPTMDERVAFSLLALGTFINWGSQFHIAVLHAYGAEKSVSVTQLALLVPFVVSMVVVGTMGSAWMVAAVWTGRIVVNWLLLHAFVLLRLQRSSS